MQPSTITALKQAKRHFLEDQQNLLAARGLLWTPDAAKRRDGFDPTASTSLLLSPQQQREQEKMIRQRQLDQLRDAPLPLEVEVEMLKLKNRFLEEMAAAYQTECEYQTTANQQAAVELQRDTEHELRVQMDRNRSLFLDITKLQDELEKTRVEKESLAAKLTSDFQKTLQRLEERHKLSMTTMQRENEKLAGQVRTFEAQVKEQQTLTSADHAVRLNDLRMQVDDLKGQLRDAAVLQRQQDVQRVQYESELVELKSHLKKAKELLVSLEPTIHTIQQLTSKCESKHGALVEDLLQLAAEAHEASLIAIGAKAVPEGADPYSGTGDPANTGSDPNMSALTVGSDASPGAALNTSGTTYQIPPKLSVMQLSAKFSTSVGRLQSVIDSQHVELALAVRCANELHGKNMKESKDRLNASYAHCQLLLSRIGDLEAALSQAKDHAFHERDKALNQRDQALIQLRARDARERRIVRHVEVQTHTALEMQAMMLANAASMVEDDNKSVTTNGGTATTATTANPPP